MFFIAFLIFPMVCNSNHFNRHHINSTLISERFPNVSSHLIEVGFRIFKQTSVFLNVLSELGEPQQYKVCGMMITLAQSKKDNGTFDEFGGKDFYQLDRLKTTRQEVVIDIGANVGAITVRIAKAYPNLQVISYECAPESIFYLHYNLFLNNITTLPRHVIGNSSFHGVIPIFGVIGDTDGFAMVRYNPFNSHESVVNSSENLASSWIQFHVTSYNLTRVLSLIKSRGSTIGIIKMDCEGCEFDVIPAMGMYLRDKNFINFICGELHLSLIDQNATTAAKKVSQDKIEKTISALKARHCDTRFWQFTC